MVVEVYFMEQYKRALELVGLIYEAALEPDLWPTLLNELHKNIDNHSVISDATSKPAKVIPFQNKLLNSEVNSNSNVEQVVGLITQDNNHSVTDTNVQPLITEMSTFTEDELKLTDLLLPHFERALKLNHDLFKMRKEREVTTSLLGLLPVGVLLVHSDGSIAASNEMAKQFLAHAEGMREEDGYLKLAQQDEQKQLLTMVDAAIENVQAKLELKVNVTTIARNGNKPPLSILVTPFTSTGKITYKSDLVALLINDPEIQQEINEPLLMSLYSLTAAEARLAKALVEGLTLDEIANKFHVSRNTLRTQLKNTFEKTGTHRQTELVSLILTGPSSLLGTKQTHPEQKTQLIENESSLGIHLDDGRWLAYAEYGDPQGTPILFFHCIISCRLQQIPLNSLGKKHGVRIIVPDRPGFGLSNPNPELNFLNWCDDLLKLTKALDISSFNIIGHLGGGPYTLSFAYRYPQYVESISVVNSMAPIENMDDLAEMLPMNKMLFKIAKFNPRLLSLFTKVMVTGLRRNPLQYVKRVMAFSATPSQDTDFLNDEQHFRGQNFAFKESTRQGGAALAQELILLVNEWGFPLDEIKSEVHIWHAANNKHIPASMSKKLYSLLPNAQLHLLENQGRFMSTSIWDDIIASLT